MNISLEEFKGHAEEWNRRASSFPTYDAQQSWGWGEAEKLLGWNVRRYVLKAGPDICGIFSAEIKSKYGSSFTYIPRGPLQDYNDRELVKASLDAIRKEFADSMFIKINPYISEKDMPEELMKDCGFRKTPKNTLYTDTLLINLAASEESLWRNIRKKYRPFIKKASEQLTVTDSCDEQAVCDFTAMHNEMSEAKDLNQLSKDFFQSYIREMSGENTIRLRSAYLDGRALAGMIILCANDRIVYKWGAATRGEDTSQIYAAHFLQWDTMLQARKEGFHFYDMGGIMPGPGDGVSHFKKGFGGTEFKLAGEFECVNKALPYFLYNKILPAIRKIRG